MKDFFVPSVKTASSHLRKKKKKVKFSLLPLSHQTFHCSHGLTLSVRLELQGSTLGTALALLVPVAEAEQVCVELSQSTAPLWSRARGSSARHSPTPATASHGGQNRAKKGKTGQKGEKKGKTEIEYSSLKSQSSSPKPHCQCNCYVHKE